MTAEDLIAAKMIKAAALGYVQQLESHNFTDPVIQSCLNYYTDMNNGTIVKRAAKQQAAYNVIANAVARVRANALRNYYLR